MGEVAAGGGRKGTSRWEQSWDKPVEDSPPGLTAGGRGKGRGLRGPRAVPGV